MKKPESETNSIGARIKAAREDKGLSQLELAKLLGFESATAVSLIESGERGVSIEMLTKLCRTLDRGVYYFLDKKEEPVNVRVALRATKDISKEDRNALIHFFELAKNRAKNDRKQQP